MKKIAVIHYLPLEFYPPVTNFLNVLSKELSNGIKIFTFSTKNNKGRKSFKNIHISINRAPFPAVGESQFKRLAKYIQFNFRTLASLFMLKPEVIVYYESYSVWPVYWYLKLSGNAPALFIHYHEYSSKDWYQNGMRLVKRYHNYEVDYLYSKACWISHTNRERLEMFQADNRELLKEAPLFVMPNYPPLSWMNQKVKRKRGIANFAEGKIRFVYVGSLSLQDTYIKEFCEWVASNETDCSLDIYAYNLHSDTKLYLKNLVANNIQFFDKGIAYEDIPVILSSYDIGLILYKANTQNYVYNAPNKLFEYLACGLDVWFPIEMEGCKPYLNWNTITRVINVNFKDLDSIDIDANRNEGDNAVAMPDYVCEQAFSPLITMIRKLIG